MKATRERLPTVDIDCIMDDITLAGGEATLAEAVAFLTSELGAIGLIVNNAKSCVLNGSALANHLGFPHPPGAKFLGAWIGSDEGAAEFMTSQLQRSRPFFESVRNLRPELALPVMSRCGVPRANYAIRTHRPEISLPFANGFDHMILDTMRAILAIPHSQLDANSTMCIHLPLADGGLGVTSMSIIHRAAYDASVSTLLGEDAVVKQDALTKKINAAIIDGLPQELRTHLRWGRDASWIHSLRPNPHYRPAILQHIRGYTAEEVACHCGAKLPKKDLVDHALGCTRIHGTNASSRHREVKAAIISFCHRNAIPVANEPVVYHGGIQTKRVDLRLTLPTEDVFVDITIANASCKTFVGKPLGKIESTKTKEKHAQYLEHVQRLGGNFVTFVVEARGSLAAAATTLTKRLQALSILRAVPAELRKEIQTAIARTNGAVITNVLRPLLVLA